MIKRLFVAIALILMPQLLLADIMDGEVPVYVWGDVKAISFVFNTAAMMIQDTDLMDASKLLAGIFGTLYISGSLIQQDLKKVIFELTWIIAIITLLFGANGRVNIVDKRELAVDAGGGGYEVVDNVPYALAIATYGASAFTQALIGPISDASAVIETDSSLSFSSSGFMTQFQVMQDMLDLTSKSGTDANSTLIVNYYQKCILENSIEIGDKLNLVFDAKKGIEEVTPADLGIESEEIDDTNCKDYFNDNVVDAYNAIKDEFEEKLHAKNGTINVAAMDSGLTNMMQHPDAVTDIANLKSSMLQLKASSLMSSASNRITTGVDGADGSALVASTSSKQDMMISGAGQFSWMAEMVPMAMHFLFMVMIVAYVPMVIVISVVGMQKGFGIFVNYVFGMVSFYFVYVSLALIQNLINYYAHQEAIALYFACGSNVFSIENIPYFTKYVAEMTGVAGIMGVAAIPFTIGIVFKGETAAATSLAMGIKSSYKDGGLDDSLATQQRADENRRLEDKSEESGAAARLRKMGVPFASGEALRTLSEYEAGMESVNKITQSNAALSSENGIANLDAASGADNASAYSEKLMRGSVLIEGGELDNNFENIRKGAEARSARSTTSEIEFGRSVGAESGGVSMEQAKSAGKADAMSAVNDMRGAAATAREVGDFNSSREDYAKASELNAVSAVSAALTVGRKGTEEAFRASGVVQGITQAGDANGALQTKVTDDDGHLIDNLESKALLKGSERAKRKDLNKTIGVGKADMGSEEDETQAMAEIQKASGKAHLEEVAAASKASKALKSKGSHDENGKLKSISLKDDYKKGVERGELDKIGGTIGKAHAVKKDKNGKDTSLTDSEYLANAVAGSAEATSKAQTHGANIKSAIKSGVSFTDSVVDPETLKNAQSLHSALDSQIAKAEKDKKNYEDSGNTAGANAIESQINSMKAKKAEIDESVASSSKQVQKHISLSEMLDNVDKAGISSEAGKAVGIRENTNGGKDFSIYSQNSEYGERSQQQSTAAKIMAQGGVDGAVNVDTLDSELKAKTQMTTLDSNLKEAGAADGIKSSGDKLSSALDKLADTIATKASAQTRGDIGSIDKVGKENYIETQSAHTIADTASKAQTIKSVNALANSEWGKEHGLVGSDGKPLQGEKALSAFKESMAGELNNITTADGDRTRSYRVGKDGKIEMSGDNAGLNADPLNRLFEGMHDVLGDNGFDYAVASIGGLMGYKYLGQAGSAVRDTAKNGKKLFSKDQDLPDSPSNPDKNPNTHNNKNNNVGPLSNNDSTSNSSRNFAGQPTSSHPSNKSLSSFDKMVNGFGDFFGNSASKQTMRSMPFLGTAAGLMFAAQEAMAGNFTRAGLELVSAGADLVPGAGTAIGLAADAALMSGVGKNSAAPQHQNAFSQPSGFKTQQEMTINPPIAQPQSNYDLNGTTMPPPPGQTTPMVYGGGDSSSSANNSFTSETNQSMLAQAANTRKATQEASTTTFMQLGEISEQSAKANQMKKEELENS